MNQFKQAKQKLIAQGKNVENITDLKTAGVKATTEEGLGFTGSGEGISSQAICLLLQVNQKEEIMDYEIKELIPEDYEELRQYFLLRNAGTCENIILDTYLWKNYYQTRYIKWS